MHVHLLRHPVFFRVPNHTCPTQKKKKKKKTQEKKVIVLASKSLTPYRASKNIKYGSNMRTMLCNSPWSCQISLNSQLYELQRL